MAVTNKTEKVTLKLELDGGIVEGKQKVVSKSFANVNLAALDQNLHGAATELAGLQKKGLLKVKRIEETSLIEE